MIQNKLTLTLIFAIYFILLGFMGNGCSKGNNPTIPSNPENSEAATKPGITKNIPDTMPVAFADSLPDGGVTGTGILGIYDVIIDPVNMTGELTSLRKNSGVGDSFVVDITQFLTVVPCSNCLKLTRIELLSNNNLLVRFEVHHPFNPGNLAQPPSASNRLDLHVFDVFGVLHFTGNFISFPVHGKSISPVLLVNADGYTGQFDSQIDPIFPTEASIHPYRVMSLDPTEGNFNYLNRCGFEPINAPTGHNVLGMGDQASADFELSFKNTDPFSFTMVITAAYGQSATKNTRLEPQYYMPEFNRKEAWKVNVQINANTLFEGNPATYCNLGIDIWDWNHGAVIDPTLARKDVIRSHSDVQSVTVEIPGVTLDPVQASGPLSGDGRLIPLHYSAHVLNAAGSSFGTRYGLVKVLDSRLPGGNAGGVGDGVNRDGVTFFQLDDFSTYQVFSVEVHRPEPIPIIHTQPDPPIVNPCENVTFNGSSSYDFDGSIVSYQWDFDYHAPVFTVDATGSTPSPVTFFNYNSVLNREVTVALRVTDNNLPIPYSTIGTCVVTVKPNREPMADFTASVDPLLVQRGQSIDFDGSTSFDPDCDILTYEWDFDYEYGNFTVDDTGVTTSNQFNAMGCGDVALRVTDQGLPSHKSDICVKPFEVIAKFEPSVRLDNTMTTRDASHALFSCAVASDPNTNDIYVAYYGAVGSTYRIRLQRSYDGGMTWGTPIIWNSATNNSGARGIALCVVPDNIPGTLYVFWIGDGANSSSPQSDGWNIRFNKGVPTAGTNDFQWWDASWHQDITLYSLSLGAPNQYHQNYYTYSQPTNLTVVADPTSIGRVYLAYSETSSNATYCGESVRLLKSTNISAYPNAPWAPVSTTSHVDSATGSVNDFTGVDIAIDSSHNVYVAWDDNVNNQIEIRKYPYGSYPPNPSQVVDESTNYAYLSNPRVAIDIHNYPVVVYNHTYFPDGLNGSPEIVLNRGVDDIPTMLTPMRVNSYNTRTIRHQDPDIAIDKNCGTIYIAYEDRRDNSAQGEIYMTVLESSYEIARTDEIINSSDPTHAVADFDVHLMMTKNGTGQKIVATWEEYLEDTWAAYAQ